MIVRELLTRIGYDVDPKAEKKAISGFERVKNAAGKLGLALSAGAVAIGFKKAIDAASDVDETMNVITTAFEDQADAVLDWARTSGEAAGRSEFAMREYAATVGAVVGPTLGSADATAQLSQDMAQLAVDLGSFFNASDEDALDALRAGLIGSQEPLLRFGVNMSVAALDAFALERGLGKTTKNMTAAEKTTLRYQFIMAKTTKAQGDAAKTSDGFANQTKRLQGNLLNIAVAIGREFLPGAAGLLQKLNALAKNLAGPLARGFRVLGNVLDFVGALVTGLAVTFVDASGTMKAAIIAVGIAAAVVWAPWIVSGLLIAGIIAATILIIEDLWLSITTGEGVIAGVVDEFWRLHDESGGIFGAIGSMLQTALDFWIEQLTGVPNAIEGTFDEIFRSIRNGIQWVRDAIASVFPDAVMKRLSFVGKIFGFGGGGAGPVPGPERITPSGSPAARSGGGVVESAQQINVNVNAPGGDGPGIAAAVAPAVGRAAADGNRQTAQQLLLGGAS